MKSPTYFRSVLISLSLLCILSVSAQGPNAPEAGSFEPVDATDMVSLITGDLTYVLPVMNVPSPEGGYPIVLAYHAGIALDQHATWAGLGWNLNPGAINRTVNGYPDDYSNARVIEYFYDKGESITNYTATLGVGVTGTGTSFGVGASWGSHKSLSGFVSIGIQLGEGNGLGVTLGNEGVGVSVGYKNDGGLTLGINANTNGTVGASVGMTNSNGEGFSVGANTQGTTFFSFRVDGGNNNIASMDFNFSSLGVGVKAGFNQRSKNSSGELEVTQNAGIGINLAHDIAIDFGDYTTSSSNFFIPIIIPLGPFSINGSFGKSNFTYFLSKKEKNNISGPLYFRRHALKKLYETKETYGIDETIFSWSERQDINFTGTIKLSGQGFMDSYEISTTGSDIVNTDLKENNLIFPAYDSYHVQAQGLSGNISPRLYDNGAIYGVSNKKSSYYSVDFGYERLSTVAEIPEAFRFKTHPQFVFENAISSYTGTSKINFRNQFAVHNELDVSFEQDIDNDGQVDAGGTRRTANHVRYFTKSALATSKLYLKTTHHQNLLAMETVPDHAIMGFQITAVDGKTYHYSLPVFNHEIITREFGIAKDYPNGDLRPEKDAYFEKRQLTPFATHWLLTAVTGPDYVDNGNQLVDDGDLGYWVGMDYGLWSDAFVWIKSNGEIDSNSKPVYYNGRRLNNNGRRSYVISRTPRGYSRNSGDLKIPTQKNFRTFGLKQVYYLDRIKTRTHTALFEKSERNEGSSPRLVYKSVNHIDYGSPKEEDLEFRTRFSIEKHGPLQLNRVLLFKNTEIADFTPTIHSIAPKTVNVNYHEKGIASRTAVYRNYNNLIDSNDGLEDYVDKASKIVSLTYQTFAFENYVTEINDGSEGRRHKYHPMPSIKSPLLKKVTFKGKGGAAVLPPYVFEYNNPLHEYHLPAEMDDFGYHKPDNSIGSLVSIKTPQGASILISYEPNSFVSATPHNFNFKPVSRSGNHIVRSSISDDFIISAEIKSKKKVDAIKVGAILKATFELEEHWPNGLGKLHKKKTWMTVTEDLGDNHFKLISDDLELDLNLSDFNLYGRSFSENYTFRLKEIQFKTNERTPFQGGGSRVASITIKDGTRQTATHYRYGTESHPFGYVPYIPSAPDFEIEVPYSSELPAPKVLYEYTTVTHLDQNGESQGGSRYHFNILKSKDPDKIRYGEFYEIIAEEERDNLLNNLGSRDKWSKRITISDYTVKDAIARIGQLKSIATLNKEGQVMNEVHNNYFSSEEVPNKLGITQESFQSYKNIHFNDPDQRDHWLVTAITRIKYPNILKSSVIKSNSYRYETNYLDFDSLTGISETVLTKDYKGNRIKSTFLPAYKVYSSYGFGLGSKYDNPTNKNMLNQTAQTTTFIEKDEEWKRISVGITTWKPWDPIHYTDQRDKRSKKVWRKHKTFVWKGELDSDGTFKNFKRDSDGFNWQPTTRNAPNWQLVNTIEQYNSFSKAIEQKDINGNYQSIHLGDGDSKTLAVANAPYGAFVSHGFEYEQGFSEGERTTTKAHTGSQGLVLTTQVSELSFHPMGGKYQLSVWIEKDKADQLRVNYNGNIVELNGETIVAGDWVQRLHYMNLPEGSITLGLSSSSDSIVIDDFRIAPISSQVITYVYNEWDELTYLLGANNLATHYTYDPSGKLTATFTEVVDAPGLTGGFKKTAEYKHHFQNSLE